MQIIRSDAQQLVIQSRSRWLSGVFALGSALWLFSGAGIALRGMLTLSLQTPLPTQYPMRIFGLLVLLAMAVTFAVMGWGTALSLGRGTTCTLDRQAATVRVQSPRGWRWQEHHHALYAVSHALLTKDEETRTFALYLVLRSHERILLGVCNPHEQAQAEQIVQAIRAFLAGR